MNYFVKVTTHIINHFATISQIILQKKQFISFIFMVNYSIKTATATTVDHWLLSE